MTNERLLAQVQPALNVLAQGTTEEADLDFDGAQTTAVRYAVIQNERELNSALEGYRELLESIAEDHETDPGALAKWARSFLFPGVEAEEIPSQAVEEVRELLQQEAPFEPYQVSDDEIKAEPRLPIELLSMIDWMVE